MFNYEEWKKNFDKEIAKASQLPDGLCVGKLFFIPVADGEAYYEVIKVFKTTVHIKRRPDLCLDDYQDWMLGEGGSFSRNKIEPVIVAQEQLSKTLVNKKSYFDL